MVCRVISLIQIEKLLVFDFKQDRAEVLLFVVKQEVNYLVKLVKPNFLDDALMILIRLVQFLVQLVHLVLFVQSFDFLGFRRLLLVFGQGGVFVQSSANILLIEQLVEDGLLHGLDGVGLAGQVDLVFLLHDEELLVHVAFLWQSLFRLVPTVLAALHGQA